MKICPACQATYSDDDLNFCLNDGAVLNRTTNEFAGAQTAANRSAAPAHLNRAETRKPKKAVKNLILAAAIIGALFVLCGGGFVALVSHLPEVENATPNQANSLPDNDSSQTTATTTAAATIQKDKSVPTLSDYNRIKTGMSYKEVAAVVGSPGVEMSSTEAGEYKTQTYKWEGDNYAFLYAVFQNDKLISKTQNNLK